MMVVINYEQLSMLPSLFCVFCPMTQSAGLQKMKSFSGRLVSSLHSAQPGCQQGAAALISPGPAADTASRYTRLLILISDVLLLKIWGSYHLRVLSIVAISTSDMFCASLYIILHHRKSVIPYFDGLHKPGCAVAAVAGVQSGETPARAQAPGPLQSLLCWRESRWGAV